MTSMSALSDLQEWYLKHCDGDWEHGFGIRINTLDNPGWLIDINLMETELEKCQLESLEIERDGQDWMHCSVQEGVFKGRGGPGNLEEMIQLFIDWASKMGIQGAKIP